MFSMIIIMIIIMAINIDNLEIKLDESIIIVLFVLALHVPA